MSTESHRRPHVRLQLPDGSEARVYPGELVGRARTAAARIDDPRVSEAMALVSLRGRSLRLLALRGMLRTRSGPVAELKLAEGMRFEVAPGLKVRVLEVVLPEQMLALEGLGPAPIELIASVHHITEGPSPSLQDGFDGAAPAVIWSTAEGWKLRLRGAAAQDLVPGLRFRVGDVDVEAVAIGVQEVAVAPTAQSPGDRPPTRIVLRQETVHVRVGARPVVSITGVSARILSEIARFDAPTPWDWVAREVWGADLDRDTLRQRWDRNLRTARAQLRKAGLPRDLVRSDGHGNIELVLRKGDEVVDEG